MFEQTIPTARRAFTLAHREAILKDHERVETLHLLAALAQDACGGACQIIRQFLGDGGRLLADIRESLTPGRLDVCFGRLPNSPALKSVWSRVLQSADRSESVGTEHLLLWLAEMRDDPAAACLARFGLGPEPLRDHWWLVDPACPAVPEAFDIVTAHWEETNPWHPWHWIEITDEAVRAACEVAPIAVASGSTRTERALDLLEQIHSRFRQVLFEIGEMDSQGLCFEVAIFHEDVFKHVREGLLASESLAVS